MKSTSVGGCLSCSNSGEERPNMKTTSYIDVVFGGVRDTLNMRNTPLRVGFLCLKSGWVPRNVGGWGGGQECVKHKR